MPSQEYRVPQAVSLQPDEARVAFFRKTYLHVAGAILALVGIEVVLFNLPFTEDLVMRMIGGRWSWLVVLGMFMGVSWIAQKWAYSDTSRGTQYLGLGIYTVAQAVILLPLLYIAHRMYPDANLIGTAAVITLALFGALTLIAFTTKKDFSFLGGILKVGLFVALGLIVCSIIFSFNLGVIFMGAMILLMSGMILYTTSQVVHHYREDQYVAASLQLFASIATMFWYVLQLLMSLQGRD